MTLSQRSEIKACILRESIHGQSHREEKQVECLEEGVESRHAGGCAQKGLPVGAGFLLGVRKMFTA